MGPPAARGRICGDGADEDLAAFDEADAVGAPYDPEARGAGAFPGAEEVWQASPRGPLQALIDELGRLPGLGPSRRGSASSSSNLLKAAPRTPCASPNAILAVKERITLCTRCFNVAEGGLCAICLDDRRGCHLHLRRRGPPRQIAAVEKDGEYRGP